MIVEWFLRALAGFVGFVLDLFPTIAVPAWVGDQSGYFAQLVGMGAGMGVWLPWSLIFTVTGVVLVCVVVGFTIRAVRIIASFLTVGGGSAG